MNCAKSLYIFTLVRRDAPTLMHLKSRMHPTAQHACSIQRQQSGFDQERNHARTEQFLQRRVIAGKKTRLSCHHPHQHASHETCLRDQTSRRPPTRAGADESQENTGVAMYLAGETEARGEHLENLVLNDLLAWRDARLDRSELYYWRTAIGEEVDLVVEAGGRLLPIEIKAMTRPRLGDTANLRTFQSEYGAKSRVGLLLHTGNKTEWIAPDVLALPWWRVV